MHQIPGWPAFTWDLAALANALATVRHEQGRHLGRMESLGADLRAEASLEVLTIDIVKSWAIGGDTLPEEEVRSSIARHLGLDTTGLPRASREVEGVVAMMLDATQGADAPLSAERLFGWHAALFSTGRSCTDRSAAMDAFLRWFDGRSRIDPTLKAAVAHLWFLTIHPFEDGNGRIARAIADMALARSDRTSERFYSLSGQIEAERGEYYAQLETAQCGDLDITQWLLWFLGCLDRSIRSSQESLAGVFRKARIWQKINASAVSQRQRLVLERWSDDFEGRLTTSKYAKFAQCSADTALRDIHELLELGIIARNPGAGRSTSYRIA